MLLYPWMDYDRMRCANFMLARCALPPDPHARYLAWTKDGEIAWCVTLEGWLGKSAKVSFARSAESSAFMPRRLMVAVSDYAYRQVGLEVLIGIVSSHDEHVMRLDRWLGFKEQMRLPGVHLDGADLVVMTMWKKDCRFLRGDKHGQEVIPAAA